MEFEKKIDLNFNTSKWCETEIFLNYNTEANSASMTLEGLMHIIEVWVHFLTVFMQRGSSLSSLQNSILIERFGLHIMQ